MNVLDRQTSQTPNCYGKEKHLNYLLDLFSAWQFVSLLVPELLHCLEMVVSLTQRNSRAEAVLGVRPMAPPLAVAGTVASRWQGDTRRLEGSTARRCNGYLDDAAVPPFPFRVLLSEQTLAQ